MDFNEYRRRGECSVAIKPVGIPLLVHSLSNKFPITVVYNKSFRYANCLGKEMVDYIADYLENIRDRRVFPNVQPGYMRKLIPDSTPLEGESWDTIFADIERIIMPGVTHWQSPHMHAYFPALNSPPSLLGDMLADAINCLGFTWVRHFHLLVFY